MLSWAIFVALNTDPPNPEARYLVRVQNRDVQLAALGMCDVFTLYGEP